jgi:hypothetical protein
MTKQLQVKHLESDYPKQDSITSMTEAFFGLKPGTLSAKPKCETCGGMSHIAQPDATGEDFDAVECPQCYPAYSTNN